MPTQKPIAKSAARPTQKPIAKSAAKPAGDDVAHPKHYTSHPSGIECIEITEHMGFNLGNAVKYIWRADLKGNATKDLQKAAWYIARELQRRAPNPEPKPATPCVSIQKPL